MPMGLWRRAREAGRAWLAPKADLPKKEVQDAPEEAQVVPINGGEQSERGCEERACTLEQDNQRRAVNEAQAAKAALITRCEEERLTTKALKVHDAEETQLVAVKDRKQTARGCEGSACRLEHDNQRRAVNYAQAAKAALITRCKEESRNMTFFKVENEKMTETVNTLERKLRKAKKATGMAAPALSTLLPGGTEAGPPNFRQMLERWKPGLLRKMHMQRQRGASTCARKLAADGLSKGRKSFDDLEVLGSGSFGVAQAGISEISKRKVAVKTAKRRIYRIFVVRELIAYAIVGNHENIINVLCMSDIRGSEGLVMEAAICDLRSAVVGTSKISFSLAQMISFEADATAGLAFMHQIGIVHVDHKLANTLVCSSPDSPSGFVGKVVDLGVCCGIGEERCTRMGTVSHAPPESFYANVAASPLDDTFAVGVDMSTMLAGPEKRAGAGSIWTHETLLTSDEKESLASLRLDGRDTKEFLVRVTHRTMTDGSFARIMLQPSNLNQALPIGELENVCHFIRNATSVTPGDRPPMAAVTNFLRALAASTAARPADPTHPPAVEDGGAGLAAGAEPARLEDLEEEGGMGLGIEEVGAMMRAVPLPFNSPRLEGSTGRGITGGGAEVAVPAVASLPESGGADVWGRLWTPGSVTGGGTPLLTPEKIDVDHDMDVVVDMTRTVPLPLDSPRLEEGGDGGGEVAVPAVAPLPGSTAIDVWGRLWTPGNVGGGSTPLLTPDRLGVDLELNEIVAMLKAVSLPFDSPRFGIGGGGGGEVAVPAFAPVPESTGVDVWGRVDTGACLRRGHPPAYPCSGLLAWRCRVCFGEMW